MKDSLRNYDFTEKLLPFKSVSEKIETVSTRRSKDFYKYWPPRNCNNCLKKLRMEKNSGAIGRNKGSFQIYFHKMEKLLPI